MGWKVAPFAIQVTLKVMQLDTILGGSKVNPLTKTTWV